MNNLSTFKATKASVLAFRLLFSQKLWGIIFILSVISSFVLNYTLLKQTYNFKCSAGGAYFISKERCDDIAQAEFYQQEYYRLTNKYESLTNNYEIYTPESE